MNKKGFSLVEVLGVIVIIAIISGLAVVSFNSMNSSSKLAYYKTLEENIKLAGSEYFNYNLANEVSINKLYEDRYLETEVLDYDQKKCTDGYVYKIQENGNVNYIVCLNCINYKTNSDYCTSHSGGI